MMYEEKLSNQKENNGAVVEIVRTKSINN